MAVKYRLSSKAQLQYSQILSYTLDKFGEIGHQNYSSLLKQALHKISVEPYGKHSKERSEIRKGVMSIHLRNINSEVKKPRHLIMYRIKPDYVEIIAILHDQMEISKHIP